MRFTVLFFLLLPALCNADFNKDFIISPVRICGLATESKSTKFLDEMSDLQAAIRSYNQRNIENNDYWNLDRAQSWNWATYAQSVGDLMEPYKSFTEFMFARQNQ